MKRLLEWATETRDRRIGTALLALCVLIYVPFAGNYGMWDPWETHYGEVARQMLERNDFVSQWWPGSPQDRNEFWSKPVLTFWVMGIGMKAVGLEWSDSPSQIADSWRVEWGSRLPFILLGIVAVWSVWELVRRLAGRRAAAISAVVLATSSQWLFVTRQAMTDMPFVAPMTIALCFAGLALLSPAEAVESELSRRTKKIGRFTLSWPHATAFYIFLAVFLVSVVPQLAMISSQLKLAYTVPREIPGLGNARILMPGVVAMIPYLALFLMVMWWTLRPMPSEAPPDMPVLSWSPKSWWATIKWTVKYKRVANKRQLYLYQAWVMCGLSTLAKGPAGVALPAIVLIVYLVLAGRWREIFTKLELVVGIAIFIIIGFPWYHAMLIRHGVGFWNEFIGDNYVHRAGGRHGDRGTFEYYIQWIGYGMFPWSGFVTVGAIAAFKKLRDGRGGLYGFALAWFVAEFAVMSLVNTKFHHYILPALPALAVLAGLFLDELLTAPERWHAILTALVAAPLTFLCGRDLSAFPPRLLWLFNYDYVNMPGTGRPWPAVAQYGDRYEYQSQILIFAVLAGLAVLLLALGALRERAAVEEGDDRRPSLSQAGALAAGFVVLLAGAIAMGPSGPQGTAPTVQPLAWLVPTLPMLLAAALLVLAVAGRGWSRGLRSATLWSLTGLAVVWSAFLVDKLLIELSPHWSQKHVIASYYAKRASAEEPLIAWQLYWRGENFYTRNAIYNSPKPEERTVFLGDHNAEKMQKYFADHAGRRVFFIVERTRFEALRQLLPANAKSTLTVVDESNCKVYLASANI
jgi:4-amino-4-deoxy-L-arabinose transferase-like glycosyltransferase